MRHKIVRREAREQERRGRDLFSYPCVFASSCSSSDMCPFIPPHSASKGKQQMVTIRKTSKKRNDTKRLEMIPQQRLQLLSRGISFVLLACNCALFSFVNFSPVRSMLFSKGGTLVGALAGCLPWGAGFCLSVCQSHSLPVLACVSLAATAAATGTAGGCGGG